MIDAHEREAVCAGAYVLEHVPAYVTHVADVEPHLRDDHLLYRGDDRLVVIGFPLEGPFRASRFQRLVDAAIDEFRPAVVAALVPERVPGWTSEAPDDYYRIDLAAHTTPPKVANMVRRAARELGVAEGRAWTREHRRLVKAFLRTHPLDPGGRSIYDRIPAYVEGETIRLLDARDAKGRLVGCDVVETAAARYDFHVFGFRAPQHAPPGTADLLFEALLEAARRRGKPYVGMGLGASPGVAFFKRKWGGVPYLRHVGLLRRLRDGDP